MMYKVIAKLLSNRVIVGYRLVDEFGNIKNIRKSNIFKYIGVIEDAYLRGDGYLGLKRGKMGNISNIDISKVRNSNFIDYSSYKLRSDIELGGITRKIVVEDNYGQLFILKFAKEKLGIKIYDYITEYIACKYAKLLGYDVQEVWLGYYEGEECVAIRMFDKDIITFYSLGDSSVSGDVLGDDRSKYNLDWLLGLKMNHKFVISDMEYKKWIWDVFLLDMMISNFDRHENNWGFFRRCDGLYILAPLFDLGASFFPKFILSGSQDIYEGKKIKNIIEFNSRSAILYGGKKKNYFELIRIFINKDNLFKSAFDHFLYKVDKVDIGVVLKKVIEYSNSYSEHINFIYNMLKIKRDMLRRFE